MTELDGLADAASMGEVCKAIAHGSLMGARGNSGVILSQLLRGLAGERLAAADEAGPTELADALAHASELARQAVLRPVEGTILTVAARRRGGRRPGPRGAPSSRCSTRRARAPARPSSAPPSMLPALKRAGVVDAGGAGLVLLFDALLGVVDGRVLPPPEPAATAGTGATGWRGRPRGPRDR